MARIDWQTINGTTNNNNAFFTGIRWRYRDDLFGTTGYPTDRISSNTDIIEYQPFVGKKSSAYTSNYYSNWLSSNYKYSYNTTSGEDPPAASNQLSVSTTYRFDKASVNSTYYLTQGGLSTGNVMNTNSSNTTRIIQIPHCNDGTSKLRLYFYFAGNSNTSFTYAETNSIVTLETIPRASSITVNDANIGSSTNIVINKASDSFTTTLKYRIVGESNWREPAIATQTSNQVYGWTVPTSLYSEIPNSKTIRCEFIAETYSDNTLVGSKTTTATFTATGNPVINNITAVDTNEVSIGLTGDSSKMIKYGSIVKVTVGATAQNSSSISSITVNGITANNNGEVEFRWGDTNVFNVVATDSRGYYTTNTITMPMVNYSLITINGNVSRNTPIDGIVNINIYGNYWTGNFGNSNNALYVSYRWKPTTDSWEGHNWTSTGLTISTNPTDNTYSASGQLSGFAYTNQYDFELKAVDLIAQKIITGLRITKGQPVYWWNENSFHIITDARVDGYLSNEQLNNYYGKGFDNVDADDFTQNGVYYLRTGCTNIPVSAYFYLIVVRACYTGTSDMIQFGFDYNCNIYVRFRNGTTWGNWVQK